MYRSERKYTRLAALSFLFVLLCGGVIPFILMYTASSHITWYAVMLTHPSLLIVTAIASVFMLYSVIKILHFIPK